MEWVRVWSGSQIKSYLGGVPAMQTNPGSPSNMKFTDNADMLATTTECAEEALHKYSEVAGDLV